MDLKRIGGEIAVNVTEVPGVGQNEKFVLDELVFRVQPFLS
ncbi:MAG: hypothetical protein WA830_22135 [Candidatus Sulfotelmatobacter sp.]